MTAENNENLEELLAEFYGRDQAAQAAEDIRRGEQMLNSHPAPQPGRELMSDIKSQIHLGLSARKNSGRKSVLYRAAAIAAVFVILAWAGVRWFDQAKTTEQTKAPILAMISTEIWQSADIAADDPDLAILNSEIEQIAGILQAVRLDENENGNGASVIDAELELIEIETDFWKG